MAGVHQIIERQRDSHQQADSVVLKRRVTLISVQVLTVGVLYERPLIAGVFVGLDFHRY